MHRINATVTVIREEGYHYLVVKVGVIVVKVGVIIVKVGVIVVSD